jgi:thiol-disulfide isomerase/thioredoxin
MARETPEIKTSTAVTEPKASEVASRWQLWVAAALCGGALLAAALPLEGRPGYELSFPVSPVVRLWLLTGLLGALLNAVGAKAAAPEWLQAWSTTEDRAALLGRYALPHLLIRVAAVIVLSRFFEVPLHPLRSLTLGVALASVEFLYDVLSYSLYQKKPTKGRRWVWAGVVLFFILGLFDAYQAQLYPWRHWFATMVHLFSAPVWFLVPTAPAFLTLANDSIDGAGALLSLAPFVLFGGAGLWLLFKPQRPSLGLGVAAIASLLGLLPSLQENPEEQEARLGALAAQNKPAAWKTRKAPELSVSSFTGEKAPRLADYPEQVKVLYFFQSFCPGCLSRGFPVTRKLEAKYQNSQEVQVFYLQTTFELASVNTWEEAKEEAESWNVQAPVAQDAVNPKTEDPITMSAYGSRGTPWTVVIDRDHNVRFSGITPSYAFIDALVAAVVAEP